MVEVTGFISHGFENFSLFDPACPPWLGVWVEYGGTVNSGTIYCCGVTSDRVRREPLVVESIPIPLVEDETFRKFDSRVQTPGGTLVHATIRGRFFSGESPSEGTLGRGYGHMGCCSLLVIQQVIQLDDTVRESIDYDPFPGGLRVLLSGCRGQMFSGLFGIEKWLQAQRDAEDRKPWAFDDPRRVATEAFESSATVMVPPAEWKKFSAPQAGLLTGGNQIEQD